jgi:hypothetical protein
MAKASARRWFGIGLAISALGVVGAFMGIYWDPVNGRQFRLSDIGLMQMAMIAGGVILCIAGIVILSVPPNRGDGEETTEKAGRQDLEDAETARGKGTDGEEE